MLLLSGMALYIHWQNHNYAVDPATLPEGVEVTHRNLNDGSCVGLAFPAQRIMSLQYHPEASPGPHDSDCGMRYKLTASLIISINLITNVICSLCSF